MGTAAFFDLDGTILASPAKAPRRSIGDGPLPRLVIEMFGGGREQVEFNTQAFAELTKGVDARRMDRQISKLLAAIPLPQIYVEALGAIDSHRRAGAQVFAVSVAPTEVATALANRLGFDGAIASTLGVDEKGRINGDFTSYAAGVARAAVISALAVEHGWNLADCHAYSDSIEDLPMMDAVGQAVAVNPDSDLASVAEERGWMIRTFEIPVPARTRPLPGKIRVTPRVGMVAGVALGAAWWVLATKRRRN